MDALAEIKYRSTQALTIIERFVPNSLPINQKGVQRIFRFVRDLDDLSKQNLLTGAFVIGITLSSLPFIHQPPKIEAEFPNHQTASEELVVKQIVTTEDQLFKNFSAEEKAEAEKEISTQVKSYKDANGTLTAERVLDWEKTTIAPILKLDVPVEKHQFWSELLSAIVYVESEGKHLAKSEAGALGLAQLTQSTAESTAKRHGIFKFDLKKGWDNLRLSRFLLEDLMERFGPDISLLGYYGGQPFADQKVLAALETRDISQINIANLGSEDGKEYLRKIVAAHRILREAKTN